MRDRIYSRQNLLLIGLLIGIMVLCFIYFVLSPQIKSYALTKKELAADTDKLTKAKYSAVSTANENDRLNKIKEDYEVKCGPFKNSTRDGSDIIFLGMMTASGNIVATEIIPGAIIEKPRTLELPVRVVLQGDYRSLTDFCREIEKNNIANLLEIRSINIESKSPVSGAKSPDPEVNLGIIKAAIGIVMFSVKDPEGKLYLEEMSKWLTGRNDVFRPPANTGVIVQTTKSDPASGSR